MKVSISAIAIFFMMCMPALSQSGYTQLEKIAAVPNGANLYLFQVATRKCWQIEYVETIGNALRFDVTGHSNDLVVDKSNGSAAIPWRWKIEKRVLSSADRVVNRCLRPEVTRSYSSGKVLRFDNGVPYLSGESQLALRL